MRIADLIPWAIGALVILSGLTSAAGKAKRSFDGAVERQRAAAGSGAVAAAPVAAQQRRAGPAQRVPIQRPQMQRAPLAAGSAVPSRPAPPGAPAPAPVQRRAPGPAARSMEIPDGAFATPPVAAPSLRQTLATAFGGPASARTAVILAEIVGPPVALR